MFLTYGRDAKGNFSLVILEIIPELFVEDKPAAGVDGMPLEHRHQASPEFGHSFLLRYTYCCFYHSEVLQLLRIRKS